ncbi:MAG: hypothetical protein PHC41_08060 [Lachnospiraceae bacterium]|nr:hypothetical protein [Lachnospiraceae bacterium]MDD3616169.1 hypothetical protein [Lachnospiraceae bacterium]
MEAYRACKRGRAVEGVEIGIGWREEKVIVKKLRVIYNRSRKYWG